MIEVERVDYIRVPVRDIEKAKHFYGEILGLEQNPNSPGDDWVEYETGNVTFALMTPHTHDYEFAPLPPGTIALRVHGAGFSDPDGNRILLHRRYAPYADGTTP